MQETGENGFFAGHIKEDLCPEAEFSPSLRIYLS